MSKLQMQFSIEDTSPPGRGELIKLNTLKKWGGLLTKEQNDEWSDATKMPNEPDDD